MEAHFNRTVFPRAGVVASDRAAGDSVRSHLCLVMATEPRGRPPDLARILVDASPWSAQRLRGHCP